MAVRMETYGKALTPAARWQDAVSKLYPNTLAGQKKGAPRAAFVGLCDAGLVKGIVRSATPMSTIENRNKAFATRAVELLKAGSHRTVTQLWTAVTEGEDVQHSAQMDVVLALWKNDLIL